MEKLVVVDGLARGIAAIKSGSFELEAWRGTLGGMEKAGRTGAASSPRGRATRGRLGLRIRTLIHDMCTPKRGNEPISKYQNFGGLVFGCIEAEFSSIVLICCSIFLEIYKISSRLHRSEFNFFRGG